MAARAYRLVGPSPQATHFVCDTEAELPTGTACHAGDTAYALDTAKLLRRGTTAWIESVPAGHVHGQADVAGLAADLAGRALASDVTAGLAARPAFILLHKRTDQSRDQVALVDCDDLAFAATPNTAYGLIVTAIFETAATSVGPRFSLAGPANGLLTSWRSEIEVSGGPSTSAVSVKSQTTPDTVHVTASVDQANTPRVTRLQGSWRNGPTAGPVRVRFASEIAGTAITVKRGSWGLVFPLPEEG